MHPKNRRLFGELQDKVFIYLRLQRFQAAEEVLKSSLEEHGPLANLLNLMGLVYHRQSQFSIAIEYFEKARASNSGFVEASLNLAVTLSDLGFYDQAEKIYAESHALLAATQKLPELVMGRVANLHSSTALGYEQAGMWSEAAGEYIKALQIFPKMPDVRLSLAKLYLRMGSLRQSQEQLGHVLGESPAHIESLNLLGAIAYRLGDHNSAIEYWKKAQNSNPNDRTSRTYLSCVMNSSD